MIRKPRYKNLVGKRFGRLIVLRLAGKNKWGNILWHCRCDCGVEKDILSGSLLQGNTRSCGCLQIEKRIESRGKYSRKNYRTVAGLNLRMHNKEAKVKAIKELHQQITNGTPETELWWNVLERAIFDIDTKQKQGQRDARWDSRYYFIGNDDKRHEGIEAICETIGLHPEYVNRCLYKHGVL